MRDFIDSARLTIAYMPGRVFAGLILALLLLVYLGGCGAAVWPPACPLEDGARRCTCGVWRERIVPLPGKPRPAGRVLYDCDGVALPITVDAEDCGP